MFRIEKKLLDPGFTQIESLEILDSKDAYKEYYLYFGKNKPNVPFLRKPNDEKNNRWVYPFPQDIWDFWVNKINGKLIDNSSTDYIELPLDGTTGQYPVAPFAIKKGRPSHVYPKKYQRLWDFIYNPEFFLNPALRTERRMPYPRYMANRAYSVEGTLPSLVPPFLPDAVYPDHPLLPYSHWQYTISTTLDNFDDLLDPSLILKQTIAFIKAYGESPSNSLERFSFSPLNITQSEEDRAYHASSSVVPSLSTFDNKASGVYFANELLRLEKSGLEIFGNNNRIYFYQPQRPDFSKTVIYPTTTTYSPMPYAPVVIHNANSYDSSGWYYFFRQKVGRSPSFPFSENEATFNQIIEGRNVFRMLQKRPASDVYSNDSLAESAAMRVLNKEASIYYGYPTYEPDRVFHYPTPSPSEMTPEREYAYQQIISLKTLILLAVSINLYEPIIDQYGDPVYEETPYKIVTTHMYNSKSIIYPEKIVSFDFKKSQSITVPSFLNISQPGFMDIFRNNRDIEWTPQNINASLVKLNFPYGSNHHVNLKFDVPGEYIVSCRVRQSAGIKGSGGIPSAVTYVFTFLNYEVSFDKIYQDPMNPLPVSHTVTSINIPFGDEASVVPLRFRLNRNHWYTHKFASPSLMGIVNNTRDNTREITDYLSQISEEIRSTALFKPKMKQLLLSVYTEEYDSLTTSYHISRSDPIRPFVFLRHSNNPYRAYLVVFIYKHATISVPFFGSTITLNAYIPPKDCVSSKFYVTWSTTKSEYLTTKIGGVYTVEKTGSSTNLIIKHPKQLTTYIANVHISNDTCTSIEDDKLIYQLFYNVVLEGIDVHLLHLLYGPFELDKNGKPFNDLSFKKMYGLQLKTSVNDYPRPFFDAMCRVYTRLYGIDLFYFALLYPYVIDYCERMDSFIRRINENKKLVILDDVPSSIKDLVPDRIHPPYVFVSTSNTAIIGGTEFIYYILFDPSFGQWVNLTFINDSNMIVSDPGLVVPLDHSFEILLDAIKKYYFYVPIHETQFLHESKLSTLQNTTPVSSSSSLSEVNPGHIPNIASFLLKVRETIEHSKNALRELSQERTMKAPFVYSKLLSKSQSTVRDSFYKADSALLYSKLYESEVVTTEFIERMTMFFREIRLTLKDPIFQRSIFNEFQKEQIQSRINRRIYEIRNEMNEIEHRESVLDFATLYTDLQRIGELDISFLFLQNKYPFDYIPDHSFTVLSRKFVVKIYEWLSYLDIPLIDAIFKSGDIESLSMNLIHHYTKTRSLNTVVPRITNIKDIPPNLLRFEFDLDLMHENIITDEQMFFNGEPFIPANYLASTDLNWFGQREGNTTHPFFKSIFDNRLPSSFQETFKIYFIKLFDLFIQNTRFPIVEILITLFIRIVKYHHYRQHPFIYIYNALRSYKDFRMIVEQNGDSLYREDFEINAHRSKFTPLLPFITLTGDEFNIRINTFLALTKDFNEINTDETSQYLFHNTCRFYIFGQIHILDVDLLSFDDFKKIIWGLRPQPNYPQPNDEIESRLLYYFHPLIYQTIIGDTFRNILTFFKFS